MATGVWLQAEVDQAAIGEANNLQALQASLRTVLPLGLLARDGSSPINGFERALGAVLISNQEGRFYYFIVFSDHTLWRATVIESGMNSQANRSPQAAGLSVKRIGIVGLGSAGSKIAISLARMGVRKFFLSDYDLLLPENLQRHGLDWQSVLLHKVDAMAVALHAVAANAEVDVSQFHLTGQESNSTVNGALNRLSSCDLLIDATGNPKAFNLLGGIARASAKPMVWLEVFGGGIGGLIARSRPGVDPCPLDMRAALLRFCSENPAPAELVAAIDYTSETAGGQVLTASDADVSIIAHHAARFAVDCLIGAEQSQYPQSMYLIGLSKCWVFRAPFDTIAVEVPPSPTAKKTGEENVDPETVAFVLELLAKKKK
jgi:sulfur-carrier protein adenylyltransferase/sulfurtransferase